MANKPLLWLRAESRENEYRTPLTPQEVAQLIKKGFCVVVESSPQRCFCDIDYKKVGAEISFAHSWIGNTRLHQPQSWVLGLKELPNASFDLPQCHIYFAHAFKNQKGAQQLLQRFNKAGGSILDLEYLTNKEGARLVAFGYWAGYVGASLALWQWLRKQQKGKLENLAPLDKNRLQCNIAELVQKNKKKLPRCLIIGAQGKCGTGAKEALQNFSLDISLWNQKETKNLDKKAILEHDIFLNCVFVHQKIKPFLTKEDLQKQGNLSLIGDISCDFGSAYNTLPIYRCLTNWQQPTMSISNKDIEVIAIDNLPSLLPIESSNSFSQALAPLLATLPKNSEEWQRCRSYFTNSIL